MSKTAAISRDATLRSIVDRIVGAVHPQRILLFGSRATGDATEASDYDLCVIADDNSTAPSRAVDVQRLFPQRDFSMDVFVLSPEAFDEQKDVANTLGYIVARDGEVLYERS